ncbi:mannosyl-3-phosphoglycerate phosphatase [Catalinimonas alkaloidigena]|uniref:HAD-IIB family hydrolase n=1 Tax=Catalinimonas alkaloidigena TaxID=1075417 RepID=UPI0024064135|nr:HAD hydrolase family protein [Catalinimonas alkaloidigena]MDF9797023.1 mannosyl-3-phosphoglycerate phosphatase [Catalinimonas alkaloidigena]
MKWIVYTDLDGTLLDFQTYSYKVTEDTVKKLIERDVPVIFCSSKTRVEQEVYRKALQLDYPFIVENGSAIIIPRDFFGFELESLHFLEPYKLTTIGEEAHLALILGESYQYIRSIIVSARSETDAHVFGYADLTLAEIMSLTGLDKASALRASNRDFSETLLKGIDDSKKCKSLFHILDEQNLLCVSGGKFHTVMGKGGDKGKAVNILDQLLTLKYGELQTIGLGDSANDLPLLKEVDRPFLVQKPSGKWQEIEENSVTKVNAIGPEGWNLAIQSIFDI